MASNEQIKTDSRLARALELKIRGLTYAEISKRMTEEGYNKVSLRTINRLLNSLEAQNYVEELKRLQLRDITIAEIPLRLKYRDKLLDKLMPRKVEQRVSGDLKQDIEVKFPELREADIARFITTITRIGMEAEDRVPDQSDDQADSSQPMDPKDSKP